MNVFIFVQILGLLTIVLSIISLQQRKKESLLLLGIFANSLFVIQFFLTNRITGAVAFIIAIIRGLVFYIYKKNGLKPSVFVLIVFQIVIVVSTILSWQGIWSIIPLIATTTNTWGQWQDDMSLLRKTLIFAAFCWLIYDLNAGMYTGFITEAINITSVAIAMWRFDFRKKFIQKH